MKLRPLKRIPARIAVGVIALVCLVHVARLDLFERLECITYDMRARQALRRPSPVATNLAFVFIEESTLDAIRSGELGYRFGLYWPRQVYGRLVAELAAQGATAVALDVIFGELRPDHPPVHTAGGHLVESDDFFALQLRQSSNAVLALTREVMPPPLFLTNAPMQGDISTEKDRDGILRLARAFSTFRFWHPLFRQLEEDPEYGVDLSRATFQPGALVLPRAGADDIRLPLDQQGNFDLADLVGEKSLEGQVRKAKPLVEQRVWHMGIVLAAAALGLDLDEAQVDLAAGRVTLTAPNGLRRVIPVDRQGRFYINWCLPPDHPSLYRQPMQNVLLQHRRRLEGAQPGASNFAGKLVVVGSAAVLGNELTDRGATPLSPDTLLVAKHWNVANSIVQNAFVRRAPLMIDLGLIILLGVIAAFVTWELRALVALGLVIAIAAAYITLGFGLFIHTRYWIPLALPVLGSLLVTHICLVTWRVLFEQADKRRVAAILSTIVSPQIARELLRAQKLELGGARREITVLFADVRGFTEFTDASQDRAEQLALHKGLSGPAAEALYDEQARETLATVNLYLGRVADIVINNEGTLDKFIGDCVMAFWGAPTPVSSHAVACVRAAIQAQRAIHALNAARAEENRRREIENRARASAGLVEKPLLPLLTLGTGINTGRAIVGLMGAEVQAVVRQGNYTVFGREVNLASRLESLSGRGRIFISQSTFDHLLRDDPSLASLCVPLPPVTVKGIRGEVKIYEVPWESPPKLSPAPAATLSRSRQAAL